VTVQLVIFADSLNVAAVCMLQNVQHFFYNLVIKNTLLICCWVDCMWYMGPWTVLVAWWFIFPCEVHYIFSEQMWRL